MAFLLHSDVPRNASASSDPRLPYEETYIAESGVELTQLHNSVRYEGATVGYTITTKDKSALQLGPACLIIGGYFSSELSYYSLAEENAARGVTTVTFDDPRFYGKKSLSLENLLHPERTTPQVADAVARDAQTEYGIPEYDIEGHSRGGEAGYRLAHHAIRQTSGPNYRSLTLLASAGATGHHAADLAFHIPFLRRDLGEALRRNPRRRAQLVRRTLMYGVGNPVRTGVEALRVSECEIPNEGLEELSENEVATIGIFYARDVLFPAARAQVRIAQSLDHFVTGNPPEAGHLAPHTHPEAVSRDYRRSLSKLGLVATPDYQLPTSSPSRH